MRIAFLNYPVIFLSALGLLSGCSITERFLSPEEKIHRAFPPSAEVRVALEDAHEALKNDPSALKSLEERIRSQIRLRSLTCTQGLSIGRLDSVESIRALPVKQECLSEQDDLLATTLGMYRLGHLLAQEPLRPLTPLDGAPAAPKMGGFDASSFDAAANANVLLVRGTRNGEFASVEIPSGKTLATLPNLQGVYASRALISPNGRLAAINLGNSGIVFLDMERGTKLWETKKFSQFHNWLPDVKSALAREAKSGSITLMDFETGRLEPYAAAPRNLTWVTPTAEKGTVWLGSDREVFQVQHVRAKDGLQATVARSFRLSQTQGITSQPPTLMNQGKTLFFVSNRDFAALDIETGQETGWKVADFLANRYAKLSETTLLVDSYTPAGGVEMKTWVLDLANRTLAPVDASSPAAARNGLLMELTGRTGWIRRGNGTTYLGSAVTAEAPQSLDVLYSAFNLERETAKLELMERQEREMAERARVMGQNPIYPPRPIMASPTASVVPLASLASQPQAGLPQNAQVEAVGVYQGSGSSGGPSSSGRKMGTAEVRVRRGSAPIILVLSSYEPVQWKLTVEPGAQLAGVLVSGYYQSRVVGAGAARVLQMGRVYAYKRGTSEYFELEREVRSWTGNQGIRVFQGGYEGGSYTVGG